jgi:SAM-dependent methyltransferase
MNYVKETFDVFNIEQAKDVVLTPDSNEPNKFIHETKFLVDKIQSFIKPTEKMIVLDYGCGMGRVSKELIDRCDCKIFGVDISDSMLHFAKIYVDNDLKFSPIKEYFEKEKIDLAISILCLQHAENPKKEIDVIFDALKPGGIFVLLNEYKRFVPGGVDKDGYVIWMDDGINVHEYVQNKMKEIKRINYMNKKIDIHFYQKDWKY